MIDSYPLHWPPGWKRTPASQRRRAKFTKTEMRQSSVAGGGRWREARTLSVDDAIKRVRVELSRLNVAVPSIIISSNAEPRVDRRGPRGDRNPADPGVAVYWTDPETKQQDCMAIDVYDTLAGNLAAVAATLDALRAIERHGGAAIMQRAFQGFKALPSSVTPVMTTQQAAELIARVSGNEGVSRAILSSSSIAKAAVRSALSKAHPDAGGTGDTFSGVQEARRILSAHYGTAL